MSMRVLFLFLLIGLSSVANAAKLESLVVRDESGKTTILCMFAGSVLHKVFTLGNPDRVVVDLDQTTTSINVNHLSLGRSLISHVRSGHLNSRVLRLVFDVKQAVSIKATTWRLPNSKQGLRIDIVKKNGSVVKRYVPQEQADREPVRLVKTQISKKPIHVKHAPPKSLRDVIIVLDPGHGGKDPGAIGPMRIAEKNVVFAIAFKLKQLIDKQPGMRAVMTRNGDYYVGLRERLNIARRYNADIFISIHADAFINKHSNGASVFALSQTGATSEAARWLAEKENYSELGGVNLSGLDDRSGLIRTVLLDLSQTATISSSVQMGTRVLHHMDKITSLHHSAVEQARFVVLKSPDIPSVLVETGFITNPRDEKNLTSPSYQARLTNAIFEGLKRYFLDYPPQGTRLEAMSGGNMHVVKAGESLPAIASRYRVTVAELKATNHLSDGPLEPGQKLTI